MPTSLIGGAVSGIGSLIGGVLGSNAASAAANQEIQAINRATGTVSQDQQNAINQQQATTGQITNELSPYTSLGTSSAQTLQSLLQPGGSLTQTYGNFNAPTIQQAEQQPGYQFTLQQGEQALQNSAAARGGLLDTGTAKNLENYAQGLATTNYNNVYNQALQTYGTNYNTFLNNQANLYNRLTGTAGLGESAGTSLGALQQSGAQGLSNTYMGGAQTLAQLLTGQGQAQAAGTVGSANALTAGLGGATNSLSNALTLQSILSGTNNGPSAGGALYAGAPGISDTYTPSAPFLNAAGLPQGVSETGAS